MQNTKDHLSKRKNFEYNDFFIEIKTISDEVFGEKILEMQAALTRKNLKANEKLEISISILSLTVLRTLLLRFGEIRVKEALSNALTDLSRLWKANGAQGVGQMTSLTRSNVPDALLKARTYLLNSNPNELHAPSQFWVDKLLQQKGRHSTHHSSLGSNFAACNSHPTSKEPIASTMGLPPRPKVALCSPKQFSRDTRCRSESPSAQRHQRVKPGWNAGYGVTGSKPVKLGEEVNLQQPTPLHSIDITSMGTEEFWRSQLRCAGRTAQQQALWEQCHAVFSQEICKPRTKNTMEGRNSEPSRANRGYNDGFFSHNLHLRSEEDLSIEARRYTRSIIDKKLKDKMLGLCFHPLVPEESDINPQKQKPRYRSPQSFLASNQEPLQRNTSTNSLITLSSLAMSDDLDSYLPKAKDKANLSPEMSTNLQVLVSEPEMSPTLTEGSFENNCMEASPPQERSFVWSQEVFEGSDCSAYEYDEYGDAQRFGYFEAEADEECPIEHCQNLNNREEETPCSLEYSHTILFTDCDKEASCESLAGEIQNSTLEVANDSQLCGECMSGGPLGETLQFSSCHMEFGGSIHEETGMWIEEPARERSTSSLTGESMEMRAKLYDIQDHQTNSISRSQESDHLSVTNSKVLDNDLHKAQNKATQDYSNAIPQNQAQVLQHEQLSKNFQCNSGRKGNSSREDSHTDLNVGNPDSKSINHPSQQNNQVLHDVCENLPRKVLSTTPSTDHSDIDVSTFQKFPDVKCKNYADDAQVNRSCKDHPDITQPTINKLEQAHIVGKGDRPSINAIQALLSQSRAVREKLQEEVQVNNTHSNESSDFPLFNLLLSCQASTIVLQTTKETTDSDIRVAIDSLQT